MKLSANMLNFLGYLADDQAMLGHWVERRDAIALAYPFGIASALKNGLIVEADYTIPFPKEGRDWLPGCPYGLTESGFKLTDLGKRLGAVGARMRAERAWRDPSPFIAEATSILKDAQRD